jgi:DEAD/DEAH box helicase domain-containing protein
MSELALRRQLQLGRWLDRGPRLVELFSRAYSQAFDVEVVETGGLTAMVNKQVGRAVVFGHPLWRQELAFWTAEQAGAYDELLSRPGVSEVVMSDLFTLARQPHTIYARLV